MSDLKANDTASRRAALRYRFDNLMSRGSGPLLGGLVVVFLAAFGFMAILRVLAVNVLGLGPVERGDGFFRQIYLTFLELTDPGSMAQDVESGAVVKVFAIVSGLIGVVIFSALIAFITTALDERLRELRRGRSPVVTSEHTVILGWNERVVDIIQELALANESESDATVVVLADRPKVDMDEFLAEESGDLLGMTLVTRTGNPTFISDLALVSLATCKAVIVLAECSVTSTPMQQQDSDISVIKRVLASFGATGDDFSAPIVCEVFRAAERAVIERIAPGQIIALDSSDILAKILVQTSRSVGLSAVYDEVLSFDGSEMYVYDDGGWDGQRFGDAVFRLPDGVPLGYVRSGEVFLNPDIDTQLFADDELLVLATDDSALDFRPTPVAAPADVVLAGGTREAGPERVLIIGWTPKTATIVSEYDDYLEPGSEIHVVSRSAGDVRAELEELAPQLENVQVSVKRCDPLDRDDLAGLAPDGFDQILLLSQGRTGGADELTTDSETIVILLLLRQLLEDLEADAKLITEILDSANSALVQHVGGQDVIVSNRLVSTLTSQVSEDPALRTVFDNLFSEDGSELYLKPIEFYCQAGPQTFATCIDLAQQRGEIAIGVRRAQVRENQGVTLIPEKTDLINFAAGDSLVVLAEDDR